MITVRDTFAELERQCLGTGALCVHGEFWDRYNQLDIQYEITGTGGGTWHLVVEWDDCDLSEGSSPEPDVIVRASVGDWLALWAGQDSAWALLDSGRITVVIVDPVTAELHVPSCLSFLGLLGPLQELGQAATSDTPPWLTEPPEEPSYPPSLDSVRLSWVPSWLPVQARAGSEPRHDARPLVESAARLSSMLKGLFDVQFFLILGVIALVLVGGGIALAFGFGWKFAPWMWLAISLTLISLPLLVRMRQDILRARLLRLEARLLPWAHQSPRVYLLLVEARLISRGK